MTESPGGAPFHGLHADRLAAYVELVRRWAPRVDLVSPRDLERFEERHVADALRLAPLLDEIPAGPCVDVGSGAGVPGVPLAIANPARRWRLLEPRAKRAAFLDEVVRALDLDCEVLRLSAQEAASRPGLAGGHVLAVARALAPPERAFALLMPLVAPGGVAAIPVGRRKIPAEAEEWAPGIAIVRTKPG